MSEQELAKAVSLLQASCKQEYKFPSGGDLPLILPEEKDLLESLRSSDLADRQKYEIVQEGLTHYAAYNMTIFSVRLAIAAVRNVSRYEFKLAVLILLASGSQIDWRDCLAVMSIFEHCANLLGLKFKEEVQDQRHFVSDSEFGETIDAFFSRTDDRRELSNFGLAAIGLGKEFNVISTKC